MSDANRGGILTMPGILASNSFPNRTSAVKRGVWVLEEVLGEHVPPPPANVPPLDKQDKQLIAGMTLRQRTELHHRPPDDSEPHANLTARVPVTLPKRYAIQIPRPRRTLICRSLKELQPALVRG